MPTENVVLYFFELKYQVLQKLLIKEQNGEEDCCVFKFKMNFSILMLREKAIAAVRLFNTENL